MKISKKRHFVFGADLLTIIALVVSSHGLIYRCAISWRAGLGPGGIKPLRGQASSLLSSVEEEIALLSRMTAHGSCTLLSMI